MEPVKISYQTVSAGPGPYGGPETFKEHVEEWSGGKIEVELVYSQAVSPFGEVVEAVADGRLDIGTEVPTYTPDKYPATNDLVSLTVTTPGSPYFGEMVSQAALLDLAWESEPLREEFESKGVDLLVPTEFGQAGALMCTDPITSLDSLRGKQIRVASEADRKIVEGFGATPVSFPSPELYDALARNVVDCGIGRPDQAIGFGTIEHAPNMIFGSERAFVRTPVTVVAGPTIQKLPLAARQLIFDTATVHSFINNNTSNMGYLADVFDRSSEYGGAIHVLERDAEDSLKESTNDLVEQFRSSEAIDGEAAAQAYETAFEEWSTIAVDKGYSDISDFEEFVATHKVNPVNVEGFANAVFEEIYLPHRPS